MSDDNQSTMPSPADVITTVQNALASLDPDSLCAGFAAIIEWIEPDGQPSMSVVHTQMAPWHLSGLLEFAKDYHCTLTMLGRDTSGDDDDEY